jgi:virginiamycin A acetyltransferase
MQNKLKKRFFDETIKALLKLKWWDWAIEKITQHLSHLTGNDIEKRSL